LNFPNAAEIEIVILLNQTYASPVLDQLAVMLSARWTWALVGTAMLSYFVLTGRYFALRVLAVALVVLGISDATAAYIWKPVFERLRPCKEYEELVRAFSGCASFLGFPSNHACNSMAAATVFHQLGNRRYGYFAIFLALMVGLSRIYLGVHYPTDIIAGFVYGAILGVGFSAILRKYGRRHFQESRQ
jgi:undecaprenyl-diphosphatase